MVHSLFYYLLQNAVPATIAIVKGRLKVGLSPADINFLASPDNQNAIKTSRRDFPYVLSKVVIIFQLMYINWYNIISYRIHHYGKLHSLVFHLWWREWLL